MQPHGKIFNALVDSGRVSRYLEIGVRKTVDNFDTINASFKVGVDPHPGDASNWVSLEDSMSLLNTNSYILSKSKSDDFFKSLENLENFEKFDLVFIDGLHLAEQVSKDFDNAIRFLKPGGLIAMHDSNPPTEISTHPSYHIAKQFGRAWCGTVWKEVVRRISLTESFFVTLDEIPGVTLFDTSRKSENVNNLNPGSYISYNDFDKNRKDILNLRNIDEVISLLCKTNPEENKS
jgi:SAM-dependent methyltransferase